MLRKRKSEERVNVRENRRRVEKKGDERERERERDLPKGEEGKPIEEVVGMEFDVFTFALLMEVR